ncbi:hypothetical protein GR138_30015 [Shinella kummerowiae]|uniref:Uncharacterized protein n=1 Tax=Shinella kummerowiae TaxID=417745 RepID=A0A6N8SKS6_9HYPH|nr:hypothetical protein [Shinella kummerowiae]MXN49431.1 hypothetical protein [Shinella kummerowiae]
MTKQQNFPGPTYQQVAARMPLPAPSFLRRVTEFVPVYDYLAAQIGFASRFDRAVKRVAMRGGGALSPVQCRFYFRDTLLLMIDPKTVNQRLHDHLFDGERVRWIGQYFVDGSDWKPITRPLHGSRSHSEIVELSQFGRDFRRGPRYLHYVDKIKRGDMLKRNRVEIDTIEKLDSYFEYYLALIKSIETKGIVHHSIFGLFNHTGRGHRWTRSFWQDLAERPIGVAINADGRLVRHSSGKHRMAAALALGVNRIPVEIRLVHARWLSRQSERLTLPPAEAMLATLKQAEVSDWQTIAFHD